MMGQSKLCNAVHPVISRGSCPRCGVRIFDGAVGDRSNTGCEAAPLWNIQELQKILACGHEEDSLPLVLVAMTSCYPKVERGLLPILGQTIRHRKVAGPCAYSLILQWANSLSEEEAKEWEQELPNMQDGSPLRLLLLLFYRRKNEGILPIDHPICRHRLWLIRHDPLFASTWDHSLTKNWPAAAVAEAIAAWQDTCANNSHDARFLGEAAASLATIAPDMSQDFIDRALVLEPNNPDWWHKAGSLALHRMRAASGDTRQEFAQRAAHLFGKICEFEAEKGLPQSLNCLAEAVFETGQTREAEELAHRLLLLSDSKELGNWGQGLFKERGHLILGQVALAVGDLDEATRRLLAAVQLPDDCIQQFGGPSLRLADDLIRQGYREAVITFLERSLLFWKTPEQLAEQWIYTIRHGGIPDWGDRLR